MDFLSEPGRVVQYPVATAGAGTGRGQRARRTDGVRWGWQWQFRHGLQQTGGLFEGRKDSHFRTGHSCWSPLVVTAKEMVRWRESRRVMKLLRPLGPGTAWGASPMDGRGGAGGGGGGGVGGGGGKEN